MKSLGLEHLRNPDSDLMREGERRGEILNFFHSLLIITVIVLGTFLFHFWEDLPQFCFG